MAKQLNVNLGFTADVSQAKKQLVDLKKQIDDLIKNPIEAQGLGLTKEIRDASLAAATLKEQLNEATNVKTGRLDLGKFNDSLKASGYNLRDYKEALMSLGPQGQKTFAALAQSITTAEIPLKRSNALLAEFGTTIKNTARWQLSSSILHGFIGSLESAYGYAEDLNKSLNDIRIVSGQSADQMAKFAKQANESAKALSASTLAYTDASLIYYQQGLDEKSVKERTDATIKMSNITGESVKDVSSYMTAMWNNFKEGSRSLESYADVMTALGSATASSTEEIAGGLEKFAAIAETAGLSFDYAATAMATVVDKTRQSEEVVGTAFKTIFARMQDLELGKTLDDGTTLGTYSQALEKIGINIKTASGEVKDMDDILDELGAKWGSLSSDAQLATAQAVAGTRQYNQLLALMNNWDAFQSNLAIAKGSEGTLEEQAEIYAESWEAARKRVLASAQGIYEEILNDDFFIDINNGFANMLDTIDHVIDKMGGVKGILLTLGTIFLSVYKNQIGESLKNAQYSIMNLTETGRQHIAKLREEANKELSNMFADNATLNDSFMGKIYASQAQAQDLLIEKAKNYTESQQKIAQILLDQHNTLVQNAAQQQEIANQAEREANVTKNRSMASLINLVPKTESENRTKARTKSLKFAQGIKQTSALRKVTDNLFGGFDFNTGKTSYEKEINLINKRVKALNSSVEETESVFGTGGKTALDEFSTALEKAGNDVDAVQKAITALYEAIDKMTTDVQKQATSTPGEIGLTGEAAEQATEHLLQMQEAEEVAGNTQGQLITRTVEANESLNNFSENLDKIPKLNQNSFDSYINLAQGISQVAFSLTSLISLFKTWSDDDLSFGDKLLTTITTLSFAIPTLIDGFKSLDAAQLITTNSSIAAALGMDKLAVSLAAAGAETAGLGAKMAAAYGPIIAVVVAIGLLTWGLIALKKHSDEVSYEGRLKKLNEEIKTLQENLQNAKQEVENISSSFDEYDSIVEKLNSCTQGTKEWAEQLTEVNNTVLDLLSTYPELAQYVERNEKTGALEISAEGRKKLEEQGEQEVLTTQSQLVNKNREARELKIEKKTSTDVTSTVEQQILAKYATQLENSTIEEVEKAIKANAGSEFRANKEAAGQGLASEITAEETQDFIDALITEIRELNSLMEENNKATESETQAIVTNKLSGNKTIMDSGYSKEIIKASTKAYQNVLKATENRYANISDGEIKEEYKKRKDVTDEDIKEAGTSVADMRDWLANTEALDELEESAKGLTDVFYKLDAEGKESDAALKSIIETRDLSKATKDQKDALNRAIKTTGDLDDTLQERAQKYVESMFNEEEIKAAGYESSEEFATAILDGISGYDDMYKSAGANIVSKYADDIFETLATSLGNILPETKIALAQFIQDAYASDGIEGAQKAADWIKSNVKDVDKFLSATSDIKWDETSVEKLKDTMESSGVIIEATDEDWASLIDTMKSGNKAIQDATESYKNMHSVIDDLKAGDKITQEQLDSLGAGFDSFFLKTADGCYKLITDAQSFYDLVNTSSTKGFTDNINKINNLLSKGYTEETIGKDAFSRDQNGKIKTNQAGAKIYSGNTVSAQLDYLDLMGYSSQDENRDKFQDWKTGLDKGSLNANDIRDIAGAAKEYADQIGTLNVKLKENYEQNASTATSLKELHAMLEANTVDFESFTKAALAMDAEEDVEGLDTDELKEYSDYLELAAENMNGFNNEMNSREAYVVAKGILKMNDAIDILSDSFVKSEDNLDSWQDILQKSDKTSEEYVHALMGTRDAVADLLDISKEYVDSDFILDHLEDIAKAATGSEEAIDGLKKSLSADVADKLASGLASSSTEAEAFKKQIDDVMALASQFDNLDFGTSIYLDDETEFSNALNKLIQDTHMTVDQVNALFDSMGFEANFANEPQKVETEVPVYQTVHKLVEGKPGDEKWVETTQVAEVDTEKLEGYVPVYGMSTDGSMPKLNSITKKASGSASNYSSKNAGGKKPGKSSGKSKSKDVKDHQKDESDPYHDIQRSIDRLSDSMDKLDKQQSHLFGAELIESLKQSNQLLQQQLGNYEKMGEVIESQLATQRGQLSKNGVIFDQTTGEMLNYAQSYAQALAAYNAAIDAYNASAQEDADKKALERAENTYKNFVDLIGKYDETLDKRMENENNKLDAQYKIIENNYKAWETRIQVDLDLGQAKQEWKKFWQETKKNIKTTMKNYAKELGNISKNFHLFDSTTIGTDLKAVEDIKAEITKIRSGQGSDRYASESEAANDLLKYSNTLREDSKTLYDMYTNAWDEYLDGIDQVIDRWDNVLEKFDDINSSLEHNAELIELLYGDTDAADSLNAKLYEAQGKNSLATMNTLRKDTEALKKERKEMLAAGAKATDADVKKLTDAINKNEKQMESEIKNYIEILQNQFQNSVKMAMKTFDKAMTGGYGINKVTEDWELKEKQSEGYYDSVQKVYQLESLKNKYEKAMDGASLKAQQKLKALQDAQLDALKDKNKLSEYDVELAEKKLAIAQAQIALEEAQNNKNTMKLTRNESGDWAYQYVADEDDVADKKQGVADAESDLYNFTVESFNTSMEEMLRLMQEYQDKANELYTEMYTADADRRIEIEAELNKLKDVYYGENGLIATAAGEAESRKQDLAEATVISLKGSYDRDTENYTTMTDQQKTLLEEVKKAGISDYDLLKQSITGDFYPSILEKAKTVNAEEVLGWKTLANEVVDNFVKNPDGVQKSLQDMYNAIKKAQDSYDKKVKEGCTASGKNFTDVSKAISKLATKTEKAKDKVESLLDKTDDISDMREAVEDLREAWEEVASSIQNATEELDSYLTSLIQAKAAENSASYTPTYSSTPSSSASTSSGNSGSGSGSSNGGSNVITEAKTVSNTADGKRYIQISNGKDIKTIKSDIVNPNDLKGKPWDSYDTGGYTGDWSGGEGRFAMLHSKELVLNKEDTQNILEAVNSVRDLSNLTSSISDVISNGIANLIIDALNGIKTTKIYDTNTTNNNESKNNTFNITAEFPNANDVEDIREAILSLPTLASQYLSQNKK